MGRYLFTKLDPYDITVYKNVKVELSEELFQDEPPIYKGGIFATPEMVSIRNFMFSEDYPSNKIYDEHAIIVGLPDAGIFCKIIKTGDSVYAIHKYCVPKGIPAGSVSFNNYFPLNLHQAKELALAMIVNFLLEIATDVTLQTNSLTLRDSLLRQLYEIYSFEVATNKEPFASDLHSFQRNETRVLHCVQKQGDQ